MNIKDPSVLDNIKKMPPLEALNELDEYIALFPEDDEALTMRGLVHWNLNHRKEAINDFLTAIRINPESRGKMALEYVNSILDYYNKDLLNP